MINYLLIPILLIILMHLYFRLSMHYNIFDIPNHRSSHTEVTIRGAGIVFPLAVVLGFSFFGEVHVFFIAGLLIISIISFIDDLIPLSALLRLVVHLLAVSLMLYALNIYYLWPLWLVILSYTVIIGTINAFNFMDGINGITGIYSVVTLISMMYINFFTIHFVTNYLIICPFLACLIFLFYNFRKKARCFAGDVGSISISFLFIALTIAVITKTACFKYIFLFSVYGIDVCFTLIKRIRLGQNILQAHRLHLYQLLVHKGNYEHRGIALAYGVIQLAINVFLVTTDLPLLIYLLIVIIALGLSYLNIQRYLNLKVA